MNIEKTKQGSTLELKLDGWLDTEAASTLREEIDAIDDTVASLIIDCTALEYISSAGLRQVVAAHKKMDGAMTLKNVSDEVMGIIKMTGLAKRLNFEE